MPFAILIFISRYTFEIYYIMEIYKPIDLRKPQF